MTLLWDLKKIVKKGRQKVDGVILQGVLLNYFLSDVKNLMFFITSLHTHGWVPSQIVSLWTQFPRLKDEQSD